MDTPPVISLLVLVAIAAGIGAVLWWGTGGDSNSGDALGTNRPYPSGVPGAGSDEPPYLPTLVMPEAEQRRSQALRRLARRRSSRRERLS